MTDSTVQSQRRVISLYIDIELLERFDEYVKVLDISRSKCICRLIRKVLEE